MRKLVVLAVLVASSHAAHADAFLEFAGGLAAPVSNSDWTNAVDPSLKLAARLGGGGPGLGGMASIDWTPLSEKQDVYTLQRFRILGHLTFRSRVAAKVTLAGRIGAGIDLVHEDTDVTVFGVHVQGSDSDVGIAIEPAGGAWFDVGSAQLGVELGIPIGIHTSKGNANNPNDPNDAKIDYTSVDLDVLFGVRLGL